MRGYEVCLQCLRAKFTKRPSVQCILDDRLMEMVNLMVGPFQGWRYRRPYSVERLDFRLRRTMVPGCRLPVGCRNQSFRGLAPSHRPLRPERLSTGAKSSRWRQSIRSHLSFKTVIGQRRSIYRTPTFMSLSIPRRGHSFALCVAAKYTSSRRYRSDWQRLRLCSLGYYGHLFVI